MESILFELSTLASNHKYLFYSKNDKIILQKTLVIFTECPATSHQTSSPTSNTTSNVKQYEKVQLSNKIPSIDSQTMKNLLVMQFDLELDLSEFTLARTTISKLKDVLSDYGEHPVALMTVIICKARLLYAEYNKLDTVEEYIKSSGELVANAYNRSHVLNLSNDPNADLKTFDDLYPLQKELLRLKVVDALKTSKDKTIVLNKKIEYIWSLLNSKMGDLESWMELVYTYLELGLFKEALWCLGEVLGLESGYWDGWALRGEICYLIGTKIKNMNESNWLITSLRCHLRALQLNENFIRSWCGVYITAQRLQRVQNDLNDSHSEILSLAKRKLENWRDSDEIELEYRDEINWVFEKY